VERERQLSQLGLRTSQAYDEIKGGHEKIERSQHRGPGEGDTQGQKKSWLKEKGEGAEGILQSKAKAQKAL